MAPKRKHRINGQQPPRVPLKRPAVARKRPAAADGATADVGNLGPGDQALFDELFGGATVDSESVPDGRDADAMSSLSRALS
eukprot:4842001-Pyramimonas_sp.AAC.1